MPNVFERLYHSPTAASKGWRTEKYVSPQDPNDVLHSSTQSPPRSSSTTKRSTKYDGIPSSSYGMMSTSPVKKLSLSSTPKKKKTHTPPKFPKVELPSQEECLKVFSQIDMNGNGLLSLAELDKAVLEIWPQFNHKPAIMRAYKATDLDKNGFVTRNEFMFFLAFLSFYNNLWDLFGSIDSDGDRRLTEEEFVAAAPGLNLEHPHQVFQEMDANHGGLVLFDEFCNYMANRHCATLFQSPPLTPVEETTTTTKSPNVEESVVVETPVEPPVLANEEEEENLLDDLLAPGEEEEKEPASPEPPVGATAAETTSEESNKAASKKKRKKKKKPKQPPSSPPS